MTDLKKPDLSKDTTGPFVTRAGATCELVGQAIGGDFIFRTDIDLWSVNKTGRCALASNLDIFLAPKEPKTVFVNWYEFGQGNCQFETAQRAREKAGSGVLALLQLEVDDQGVPVHNSVVRRVEG